MQHKWATPTSDWNAVQNDFDCDLNDNLNFASAYFKQ